MNGTYIKNLETGKIELRFSKADYLALPEQSRVEIKSRFLFSGRQGCWVSRATNSHYWAIEVSKKLGLEDGGEIGQRLSFAEQQQAMAERAEDRALRMAEHAQNATERAAVAFDRADLSEEKTGIPFGQPILVGHHSEGRHRRAIEQADNAMRRGVQESEKAKYFEQRAESAEYTASHADLQDKRYLQNRLDENQAKIRAIDRALANQISHDYRNRLEERKRLTAEKFDYYSAAMAKLGGVGFSRQNVKPLDMVKIRGRWEKVVKCNTKTVAVTSCFPWAMKYPWAEVQEHKAAN